MILTDKAREDFLLYKDCLKEELNTEIHYPKDVWLYADIIDWFDSVGIIIEIGVKFVSDIFIFYVNQGTDDEEYSTRQEATKQAIIKANEIYNEKHKQKWHIL